MEVSGRSSNIRAILSDDLDVRRLVLKTVKSLDNIMKEDARGARLANMLDPEQPENELNNVSTPYYLEDEEHGLLVDLINNSNIWSGLESIPKYVVSMDQISIHGVRFATERSKASSDSLIMFSTSDSHALHADLTTSQHAGIVQMIFQFPEPLVTAIQQSLPLQNQIFLAVLEYTPLDLFSGLQDPYPQFGFAAGFICNGQPAKLHVISSTQVVSHFAKTPMMAGSQPFIHVLPVDRVSDSCLCFLKETVLRFTLVDVVFQDG